MGIVAVAILNDRYQLNPENERVPVISTGTIYKMEITFNGASFILLSDTD